MAGYTLLLVSLVAMVTALPVDDPVVLKLDENRFHYMRDASGEAHLVDLWAKASDLNRAARYSPDIQNQYHLFTRSNPSTSQPLVLNNLSVLQQSNFQASRRTIVLIHGWMNSATSEIFTVLVPAFLAAEDVNVIVVDWSSGAMIINYATAVINTVTSGESVARFLNWLSTAADVSPASFHIAGHSLGGQQSGVVGRNLASPAAYVTALDPALPGWITNDNRFKEDDGSYTEVIHTNSGFLGFLTPLGHVDFYPNGGTKMPGCNSDSCDHSRAYYYFAESITSGGFTGTRCQSYITAIAANCNLLESLNMGGLAPKTGQSGVFYLETNAAPPFSQG